MKTKYRSKKSAFFLSVISLLSTPGLGQVCAGKGRRGLILLIFFPLTLIFSSITGLMHSPVYALIQTSILMILSSLGAYDAFRINTNKDGVQLRWYNRWYFYICYLLIAWCALTLIPPTVGYERFKIKSASLTPTLEPGEIIIAKTKTPLSSNYQYHPGDMIVFKGVPPLNRKLFIKRIVAIGNQTYSITNGIAHLNGNIITENFISPKNNKEAISRQLHQIKVPPGYVFVLGDNRDNSDDSRQWGFIPINNIIGKVLYIYWSKNLSRIGFKLTDNSSIITS